MSNQDPEMLMRDFAKYAEEMAARAESIQAQMAEMRGEGSNEVATVIVGAGGVIESVRFTSQVRSMSPESLAEEFMDAYAVALGKVNATTQSMVGSIGPEATEMADFIGQSFSPQLRERAERADEDRR